MKYIGYYSPVSKLPMRSVSLAARNKMDYTISVLNKLHYTVEVISPATTILGSQGVRGSFDSISDNVKLKLFSMFPNKNRLTAILNNKLTKIKLFLFLLRHTSKNEPVLVYHSLATSKIIRWAKKIKGFKIILELNEIYSDVSNSLKKRRKEELKIINVANGFLFANDLMNKEFNKNGLPYAVEYGVYSKAQLVSQRFKDGKIHVVYAGTLDPDKGGAEAAAEAAIYLPENYHIHILGFGDSNQKMNILKVIDNLKLRTKCGISYDGVLDGKDFIKFLQKCHIGLSTQNPNAAFNDTSFPSKILTYLANGLQVVSVNIPAISESKIASAITFYNRQTPKEIAHAIESVENFNPRFDILKKLDEKLENDLSKLFSKI